MNKTILSLFAAGALFLNGCSENSAPSAGENLEVRAEQSAQTNDFSTDITQVSLYRGPSEKVQIRDDYALKFEPKKIWPCFCLLSEGKKGASFVIFDERWMCRGTDKPWAGLVYPFKENMTLGSAKSLHIRAYASGFEKLRAEIQSPDQPLGDTYRDEFQLYPNAINDITVDLAKLMTNNGGSVSERISELKLIADTDYMKKNTAALIIYDMGLK
jgi:hypothetical protein